MRASVDPCFHAIKTRGKGRMDLPSGQDWSPRNASSCLQFNDDVTLWVYSPATLKNYLMKI